jgi:4a-hydroxytetrahydrobiopterin dehydratase
MPDALTETELREAITGLPDWRIEGATLRRDVRFPDFLAAFSFLTAVAMLAERHGHHPEIRNVYRDVTIALTTHDAGDRVTELDVALATAIDRHLTRRDP